MLIQYALAAQSPGTAAAASFVERFNEVILFPLITLLIAVALLLFVYGGVQYIAGANNPTARETGRKHMIFGIIGMIVMLSALAILSVAANTFGLGDEVDCANNPAGAGCQDVFRIPDASGPGAGTPTTPTGPGSGTPTTPSGPGAGQLDIPGGP